MNKKKTYTIQTLGCKVNQYESESIACQLQANGFEPAFSDALFAIINTCTVTQKAGMQSRQLIRQTIRKNQNAIIFVTGCHAQICPEDIQTIDGIHYIVGNAFKHNIVEQIIQLLKEKTIPNKIPVIQMSDILKHKQYDHIPLTHMPYRTRPTIKIQDGCNAFCSYCIVPFARGPSRSLSEKIILEQIKYLQEKQYKEIVLSGIHLGHYGQDFKPPISLTDLLNKIMAIPNSPRIRLSSIEPQEVTEELINLIYSHKSMCHHLHISLQSGDDVVLQIMNRHYNRSFFKDLICRIHRQIPDIAIGIDILVGTPGETQRAFENTVSLLEQLPAAYFHVFPFSLRKGTQAEHFKEMVPIQTIKERAKIIRLLGDQKKLEFFSKNIGLKQTVLIETISKNGYYGHTGNYIPVRIPNSFLKQSGQIIHVVLKKVLGLKGMEAVLENTKDTIRFYQ